MRTITNLYDTNFRTNYTCRNYTQVKDAILNSVTLTTGVPCFNSYCHEGSVTVDSVNQTWTFTGTGDLAGYTQTFNYSERLVVFLANLGECQKFENTSGKFSALVLVDTETTKVYACTRDNNGNVTLNRLFASPFSRTLLANEKSMHIYNAPDLAEGEVAYDYTS